MARILRRERLVPNIHILEVHAPEVAAKCAPGQFVIVMPDPKGERIPLTIADWDPVRGSVTSVFMVVGTSTQKLSRFNAGDEVPVYVGPLGKPSAIEKFGTVLCAGGCFGIAAIHPVVRALKAAGNRVLTLLDAKAGYLLYWEDRIRAMSDRHFVSSRDPLHHTKDYISRTLDGILKEEKVDRVVAIGCTYLMSACSETTRPMGIKTMVSLNPIMVDGTGMCGACRVTVGGATKFVCVDWRELYARRRSYFDEEIRSLCDWEEKTFP
jgi:NAD(P)H-flavin reductase